MAANRIQLQNALHKPYDRVLFSREVLYAVFGSGFSLNSALIPAALTPNKSESAAIDKVWIYGNIKLDDSTEITCFEVLLQPQIRIEQSKVAIQQYVRKLLTAGQAALINFVAPANNNVWRLTLVAKDSVLTDKGVKEKTTTAKRYTFLLGPSETCKTAAERFEVLSTEKEINFQTLVNAFSVEKLSKAFFDEYTLHYKNYCNYLQESIFRSSVFNISWTKETTQKDKDKLSKPIRDFVKKMLGRIVFLYFVQKKGWLGASNTQYIDGSGDFIKKLFVQSGGSDSFYYNWLSVLFFDTLNRERLHDEFKMPDGSEVKVPFLNGGLFDKEDYDDGILTFPSKLFHNSDFEDVILTEKNSINARGFLDFLDAFNFTIHEDSPDDHTVAVDPEMLGHIFENLLEDNKDKGAFYTPKEIVHYMCQESLIEYLTTHLANDYTVYKKLGNDQLELFGNEARTGQLSLIETLGTKGLDREEVQNIVKFKNLGSLTEDQMKRIDNLLDIVKICDPAIGSGAFPMGLLQEIFSIKELIAYQMDKDWDPARTKLNIIQNSIYGVDIEKGAVDIARLRFWLSLVVDEEKPKPLPNLDYKIVVGDSLISKFEGEIIEVDWDRKHSSTSGNEYVQNVQRLLREVAEKQKKYFNPDSKNKKLLQTQIRNLKIELLINQLSFNKELYKNSTPIKSSFAPSVAIIKHNTERELQIRRFDKLIGKLKNLLKSSDELFNHFDWKLDFPEVLNPYLVNGNGGFDIVIGNPPYGASLGDVLKVILKNRFNFLHTRTIDSFNFFIGLGLDLLKNDAVLTFIIPSAYLFQVEFEKSRGYFMNNFSPKIFFNLGENIFEAVVPSCIFSFIKSNINSIVYIGESKDRKNGFIDFSIGVHLFKNELLEFGNAVIPFNFNNQSILKKINCKCSSTLGDICKEVNSGITTGHKTAFIIPKSKALKFKIENDILFPTLEGRNINQFKVAYDNKVILYIDKNFNPKNNPNTINYLKDYYDELSTRSEVLQGIKEWYSIGRARGQNLLAPPKLMCRETGDSIIASFDDFGYYPMNTVICLKLDTESINLYKSVCCLLNSTLINFIFKSISQEEGRTFAKVRPINLRKLPIPNWTKNQISFLSAKYDLISENKDVDKELFDDLNNFFYHIYELSYDEVKAIAPEFSLSKEEYEQIEFE